MGSYSTFNQANLTASTKTANVFSGDINEFVGDDSLVNIYTVSSAAGVNMTLLADQDVAMDDKEIIAIGTTLNKNEHLVASFLVAAGTRLSCFLRETAASATTDVLLALEVIPA